MKKIFILLISFFVLSFVQKDKKKSWLEQWGYKGKMKSVEYSAYHASKKGFFINKDSVISRPFLAIDEWVFPHLYTKYNLYGDIEERVWSLDKDKEELEYRKYIYDDNKLSYIQTAEGRIKATNDKLGYLVYLDFSELGFVNGAVFVVDDNGYIVESKFESETQKHQYDMNGNWIQSDIYSPISSDLIRRTKLTYKGNKRNQALMYDANGRLIEIHEYGRYDKENNFTEIVIFDHEENPLFIIDIKREYY